MIPEMPEIAWGMFDRAFPEQYRQRCLPPVSYLNAVSSNQMSQGFQDFNSRFYILFTPTSNRIVHWGGLLILCDWLHEELGDEYEPMLARARAFLNFHCFLFDNAINLSNPATMYFRIPQELEMGTIISKISGRDPRPIEDVASITWRGHDSGYRTNDLRCIAPDDKTQGIILEGNFSFHEQLMGYFQCHLPDVPHWWKEVKDDQVLPFMARYMKEWDEDERLDLH